MARTVINTNQIKDDSITQDKVHVSSDSSKSVITKLLASQGILIDSSVDPSNGSLSVASGTGNVTLKIDTTFLDNNYKVTANNGELVVGRSGGLAPIGVGNLTYSSTANTLKVASGFLAARNINPGDLSGYVFGREYIYAFHKKLYDQGSPSIVLAGDSTTQLPTTDSNYSPDNLIKEIMLENYFTAGAVYNAGVSGSNTNDWITFYLSTQLGYNPDLFIIRYGINDGMNNRTNFEANLRSGLATIRASKTVAQTAIILMSPSSTNDTPNGRDEDWYVQINPIIRKAARDYQCVFIDTYTYFRDSTNAGAWMDNLYGDGRHIHPDYLMNMWIYDIIGKVMFPKHIFNRLIGVNNLQNIAAAYLQPTTSTGLANYKLGVNLHRAATGWPNDGQVITFRHTDGSGFQINAASGSTGYSFRNGNTSGWQTWKTPFNNGDSFLSVNSVTPPSWHSTATAYFYSPSSGSDVVLEGASFARIFMKDGSEATDRKIYEILNYSRALSFSRINDDNSSRDYYLTLLDGGAVKINKYGIGSFVASNPNYLLGVNSSGQIVETPQTSISSIIGGSTTGSVLFIGASSQLAQNNGAFFWDNGSQKLGLGLNTPATALHVKGAAPVIRLEDSSGTVASFFGNYLDSTQFAVNRNPSVGSFVDVNKAAAQLTMFASNGDSGFVFYTSDTNNTSPTEKVRIAKDGKVGIGTSSPTHMLTVKGPIAVTDGTNVGAMFWYNGLSLSGNSYGQITLGTDVHIQGDRIFIKNATSSEFAWFTGSTGTSRFTIQQLSGLTDNFIELKDNSTAILLSINNAGNLALGVSSATAKIHIAGVTTTAGSAPIKFTSGTLMTTPENGALEYTSSHLYFTIGSTRYQLDQQAPATPTLDAVMAAGSTLSADRAILINGHVFQVKNGAGHELLDIRNTSAALGDWGGDAGAGIAIEMFFTPGARYIQMGDTGGAVNGTVLNVDDDNQEIAMRGGYETLVANTSNGSVSFPQYGTGTKTGTATYGLAFDSSGNIIEVALSGSASDGITLDSGTFKLGGAYTGAAATSVLSGYREIGIASAGLFLTVNTSSGFVVADGGTGSTQVQLFYNSGIASTPAKFSTGDGIGSVQFYYADAAYKMDVDSNTTLAIGYASKSLIFTSNTYSGTFNNESIQFEGNLKLSGHYVENDEVTLGIDATWETGGAPTAILLNVTDIDSDSAANLLDLQVNDTSKFFVDKSGNTFITGLLKITGGGPGAGKVLTSNASGLATWEDPSGGSSNAKPEIYGERYNVETWSSTSDFTIVNATVSVSSGELAFSGGAGTFTHTASLAENTCLDKFSIVSEFKVSSNGNGLGIGVKSINSSSPFGLLARFDTSTGNLSINAGSNASSSVASTGTLSFSSTDILELNLTLDNLLVTAYVRNKTTNTQISVSYVYGIGSLDADVIMPNTGQVTIWSFGGNFNIRKLRWESGTTKNANYLIIGDSKTRGYYSELEGKRYSDILNDYYSDVIINAGGGDTTVEVLARIDEIIALAPKNILLSIGSNDIRNSVSGYTTNYDSIVSQLETAGINVYHLLGFYETSVDQSALVSHITSTYTSDVIIDCYNPTKVSGSLYSDNIHLTAFGNSIVAKTIIDSGKLTEGHRNIQSVIKNQTDYIQSAGFNIKGQALFNNLVDSSDRIRINVAANLSKFLNLNVAHSSNIGFVVFSRENAAKAYIGLGGIISGANANDFGLRSDGGDLLFSVGGNEGMRLTSSNLVVGGGSSGYKLRVTQGSSVGSVAEFNSGRTAGSWISFSAGGTSKAFAGIGDIITGSNNDDFGIRSENGIINFGNGATKMASLNNGILTVGSGGGSSVSSNVKIVAAGSTTAAIGTFSNNKGIYLGTNTTSNLYNLDAYDYNAGAGLDIRIAGNGGKVYIAGLLGLGTVSTATANLHLPAGTATAGTAPMKFTTGTAMTTPEDGALEYHSSHLYFTIGSTRYQLDQQSGGGSYTFSNGLTNTSGTVTLGGSLTGATTLTGTTSSHTLTFNGNKSSGFFTTVANSGAGDGLQVSAGGTGFSASGTTGISVYGSTTGISVSSGYYAGSFYGSNTGALIAGDVDGAIITGGTGIGLTAQLSNSNTNSIQKVLKIERLTTGTAANGIGSSISFYIQNGAGTSVEANTITSSYTSVTAGSTASNLTITGISSGTAATLLELAGSGQLKLNKYGVNSFTGTAAYYLATTSSGSIIEVAPPASSSTLLYSQVAAITLSGTTSETSVVSTSGAYGSTSIASNYFSGGKVYKARAMLVYSTSSTNPTGCTFKFKLGSTTYFNSGNVLLGTNKSNLPLILEVVFIVLGTGSSGTLMVSGTRINDGNATAYGSSSSVTLNTTISNTFDFSLQLSDSSAGNTIALYSLTFEEIK